MPALLPALQQHVGAHRLLYGSDFCFTPPVGAALQLGALDATEPPTGWPTWRQCLAANAVTLLGPNDPPKRPHPSRRETTRRRIAQSLFQRVAARVVLGDRRG